MSVTSAPRDHLADHPINYQEAADLLESALYADKSFSPEALLVDTRIWEAFERGMENAANVPITGAPGRPSYAGRPVTAGWFEDADGLPCVVGYHPSVAAGIVIPREVQRYNRIVARVDSAKPGAAVLLEPDLRVSLHVEGPSVSLHAIKNARKPTPMTAVAAQDFYDCRIVLDNHSWADGCTFTRCNIVYGGGDVSIGDVTVKECELQLIAEALNTVVVLGAIERVSDAAVGDLIKGIASAADAVRPAMGRDAGLGLPLN